MALPVGMHFGVDLVDQTLSHVAFLKAVSSNKELRKPETLKRALYRYQNFWLPLVAEHPREYLSAPMDIEWVWYCHMLSPKAYEIDCNNIVRVAINHTVLRPDDFQRSRSAANAYWSERYLEPFYIDYNSDQEDDEISDFNSRISIDILTAVERQMSFLYQVSLPHYLDRKFLQSALSRYTQFLLLKRQHPGEFLVPSFDIQLIWHTHQLNPIIYKNDIMRIVGQLFDHSEKQEGSKLNRPDKIIRELWKKTYNESLSKCGTMFRGYPPTGNLYTITHKDEFTFCTKLCVVSLDHLALHVLSPGLSQSKHIELKAGSVTASRKEVAKWFTLKRPSNSRQGKPTITWSKVGSFNFNTGIEHGISFSIQQKASMMGAKTELDSNILDIIPFIESPVNFAKPGGLLKRRLTFNTNAVLDIQGHFEQPKIGDVHLSLEEGAYRDDVIPDDVQKLFGPTSFERLPPACDNRCKVAVHKLKNHLGQVAIQVRTIHSAALMTSVIQVLFQNKMCSVAHLIAAEQLPLPTQVNPDMVALNAELGERAVLIKNDNGDWGILYGHWVGYRAGAPPSRDGHQGVPGSPGTLRINFYKMSTGEVTHIELAYRQRQYSVAIESTRVDLRSGIMQINPQSNEVAENISLVFAISLLHVLCVPRPNDWTEGAEVSGTMNQGGLPVEAVPSDFMACVKAAGLTVETPSNHYIATHLGNRFSAMCFGSREANDEQSDIESEWDDFFVVYVGESGYDVNANATEVGYGDHSGGIDNGGFIADKDGDSSSLEGRAREGDIKDGDIKDGDIKEEDKRSEQEVVTTQDQMEDDSIEEVTHF